MSVENHPIYANTVNFVASTPGQPAELTSPEGLKVPTKLTVEELEVKNTTKFAADTVFHGNVTFEGHVNVPGGGISESQQLQQLTDTNIVNASTADKSLLQYDTASERWVASAPPTSTATPSTIVARDSNSNVTVNKAIATEVHTDKLTDNSGQGITSTANITAPRITELKQWSQTRWLGERMVLSMCLAFH